MKRKRLLTSVGLLVTGIVGVVACSDTTETQEATLGGMSQAISGHHGFGRGFPGHPHWWPKPTLKPFVDCVEPGPQGSYVAHWGYENEKDETKNLPIGFFNHFPWPWDRGQPRSFEAGEHHKVFTSRFLVRHGFGSTTWWLDGRFAVATRFSPACAPPPECETNSDCADDLWCNGSERCEDGACMPGDVPCVDTANTCDGVVVCDEAVGYCVAEGVPEDGTTCLQPDTEPGVCQNQQCVPEVECTTDSDCNDNLGCNGSEQCIAGACSPGTVPCADTNDNVCDGGVTCTEEPVWQCIELVAPGDGTPCTLPTGEEGACLSQLCLPEGACLDTSDCDDGLGCNGQETCVDNECVPGTVPCQDTDDESCNGGVGCTEEPVWQCVEVTAPDEGTSCPMSNGDDGVCASGQCVQCQTDNDCSDGLFCTGTETCSNGACQPGTSPCVDPDSNVCNGGAACSEDGCTASAPPPDGTSCTLASGATGECAGESCVLFGACIEDIDCSDGLFCTGTETCSSGACQAGTSPCVDPDGDACNGTAACSESGCSAGPATAEGDACDIPAGGSGTCVSGVCTATP